MGIFGSRSDADKPVKVKGSEKLMSYNQALGELRSGDNSRMFKANMDINVGAERYQEISLNSDGGQLIPILLPLLEHENYQVRVLTPVILGKIGTSEHLPYLQKVVDEDSDNTVRKNAREAIGIIKSKSVVDFSSIRFVQRLQKPVQDPMGGVSVMGTYDEYTAPSKAVARAWLETVPVDADYYYIEVNTPEGPLGKDKMSIY